MVRVINEDPIHETPEDEPEDPTALTDEEQRVLDSLELEGEDDETIPSEEPESDEEPGETDEGEETPATTEADDSGEDAEDPQLLQLAMFAGLGMDGYEKYKHNPAMIHAAAQGVLASRQSGQTQPSPAEEPEPELEFNEDDFDPEIAKVLKAFQGQIKSLKSENAELRQGTQMSRQQQALQEQQKVAVEFDEFLNKLESPKLGKGSYVQGTLEQKFVPVRDQIYVDAEALMQAAQNRGKPISRETAWKRAVAASGLVEPPKPKANPKRRNAQLNRGSYGESFDEQTTDEDRALAAMDNLASERGFDID